MCHLCAAAGEDWDDDTDEGSLDGDPMVCRGFYDEVFLKTGTGQLLRIMERLGGIEFTNTHD